MYACICIYDKTYTYYRGILIDSKLFLSYADFAGDTLYLVPLSQTCTVIHILSQVGHATLIN